MTELIRDTVFGHLLRWVSRGTVLSHPEDLDPSIWRKYVHEEKTARMAHHGHTGESDSLQEQPSQEQPSQDRHHSGVSDETSRTRNEDNHITNDMGMKVDAEMGKDLDVIHFEENDPENPLNWSSLKKVIVTAEICLLTTSVYIGSAIYTAGELGVVSQFGVSRVAATLGLTLFVAGYGVGPMLWAPMSEIPQIGRNPIYIGTLIVFVALQLPVIFAKNFGMLLAFRFITGFVGSPVLATGGASIADMYRPQKRAYAIAIWGISAVCGPVLGPLVGGFAAQYETWQWTIWELMWLSGFTLVLLVFFLPETSSANILYRRSRRLRVLTSNEKLTSEPELAAAQMTGKDVALIALVRPFTLNFTEPMVFLLNLYIGLVYGLLYVWFESFPIVFTDIYGFSLSMEGVSFVGILVGAFVAIPPFFWYLHKYIEPEFNENGEIMPEKRLLAACVGSFFVPICLFWFGWSAGNTHWIMPIIGSAFFSVAALILFNCVLNYLGDAYPDYAASVLAGNDLLRSGFGAGFPLFANAMYENLGVDWASSTLAFLGIAFIPIPFVLYMYGERLRKISRHARKDF